jgi:putative hydrolase of the HAD superfamily
MNLSEGVIYSLSQVNNIIFDWGGVLTNLDFDALRESFKKLVNSIEEEKLIETFKSKIFLQLETGQISEFEFRNQIKEVLQNDMEDDSIDEAWCSLLGDTAERTIHLLQNLSKKYNIFLLSNTNSIHVAYYKKYLKNKFGIRGWEEIFIKTFYSHELGMRKPSHEIFHKVLAMAEIKAEETLFCDDFEENIRSANEVGMHTYWVKNTSLLELQNYVEN